ncbi:uncharacterized protein LOC132752687 [Ruditapes philippinarum]|uniref:uncharacterized protein LOC132752687 n=1 Tax=Ruditapes philippinarum TaxID=129788 RepID=UPI00295B6571|nr:uncharacterized protein LOC132752687 [Ruditapes philippinarum]
MEGATETTNVLVTGAAGFIATHIIQQLQEEGYKVRGTLRSLEDKEKVERLQSLSPEAEYKLELVEADLTKPESWEAAVQDVTYVIHVASPNPSQAPKDESEVITPAVEGTQAILKACVQAKSVKKVVLTSSSVAVCYGQAEANKVYTEEDWMEPEKLDGYGKSKVNAEKAAWDYVKELPDEDKIELSVVNPGYVLGPVLSGAQCTSTDVVKRLLERNIMFVPKLNFSLVDVRDVAAAHIKAMTLQEASGKRHILVNENLWMKEIAVILSNEFKTQGYNVPTSNCPNAMLSVYGILNKSIKMIIPQCNKVIKFDNSRMKEVLGITPRDVKETIIDMAYSLIEAGLVKKSKKYKGPGGAQEDAKEEDVKAEDEEKKEPEDEKAKENGDIKDADNIEDDLKKEGKDEGKEGEETKDNKEVEEEKNAEKTETEDKEKSEEKSEEKTEEANVEKKEGE